MVYSDLNHYSYLLIGVMKRSLKKKNADIFQLEDLDFRKFHLRYDNAIASLSLPQLIEVLNFIDYTASLYKIEHSVQATYSNMRSKFKGDINYLLSG